MRRAVDGESEEAADDAPLWADVLIDLILSLLTKNSKLTKNMLLSSFKHICGHITNAGVQYLVDAINPSNDNKLFGGIEDSDVDDEEMDAEEESDKSESESESEDEEPTGEVDENFRNDVINALGAAAENDDDEVCH
jgi:DNA polymerase phi